MLHKQPSQATMNLNNTSTFTDRKRNKKPTLATGLSRQILKFENVEEALELIKISIKKQIDRRNKLMKLLDKYVEIQSQQKDHVKMIKSSIIQMKDAAAICKIKLMICPSILVQNKIKVEVRQFLCTLMNTFYRTYDQNDKNNLAITNLNNTMSFLIKGISFNEDMKFLMQKTQINQQIQLEGELLMEKNRIKQESARRKDITEQHNNITKIYQQRKQKYDKKKQMLAELRNQLQKLTEQSDLLKQNISFQEKLRDQCQGQIDTQLLYQRKLKNDLFKFKDGLQSKSKQSRKMLKKLLQYRVQNQAQKAQANNTIKAKKTIVGQQKKQKMKFQMEGQFKLIRG